MVATCPFCASTSATLSIRGAYHPRVPEHGPFDLYRCRSCGSILTSPLPSAERLAWFYGRFSNGLPARLSAARAASPQRPWFAKLADRIASRTTPATWVEAAPGEGYFAEMLAARFPNSQGTAIDFHPRPNSSLSPRIAWRQGDLNADGLDGVRGANLVVALAVLEHILNPRAFLRSLIRTVEPRGWIYVICPDAGSWLGRALGRRWPYLLPGEHIAMPTAAGMRALVSAAFADEGLDHANLTVRSITVPYTVRYLAAFAGITLPVPNSWAVPVPAGVLELMVRVG